MAAKSLALTSKLSVAFVNTIKLTDRHQLLSDRHHCSATLKFVKTTQDELMSVGFPIPRRQQTIGYCAQDYSEPLRTA